MIEKTEENKITTCLHCGGKLRLKAGWGNHFECEDCGKMVGKVYRGCPYCDGEMIPTKAYREGYENFKDDPDAIGYYFQCRSCASTSGWSKGSFESAEQILNMRVPTEKENLYRTIAFNAWMDATGTKYPSAELNYLARKIWDMADDELRRLITELKLERQRRKSAEKLIEQNS